MTAPDPKVLLASLRMMLTSSVLRLPPGSWTAYQNGLKDAIEVAELWTTGKNPRADWPSDQRRLQVARRKKATRRK